MQEIHRCYKLYLQCFSEFGGEGTFWFVFTITPSSGPAICAVMLNSATWGAIPCMGPSAGSGVGCGLSFALGRLRGVSPKQFVLKRRTIEAANDCLHLVCRGRFHERESFGLLGFVVADYFCRIRY